MSVIELEFRSRGGSVAIKELQRLQASLKSTTQDTIALAKNLGVSFRQAQQFSKSIGASTGQLNRSANIIKELRSVNADLGVQYKEVANQVGLSREQFLALNSEIDRTAGLSTTALGAIALGSERLASALVNVGQSSVNIFTDLEGSINQFAAISQESEQVVQEVQQVVQELGSTTAITAREIGDAAVVLARFGFEGETVKTLLPAIAQGAVATGESTETLARVLGNIVNQFGELDASAARFQEINDILVNTANSSATNVNDLGDALGYAGATAKNAGQSIETTTTILGLFANAGITGTRAGTAYGNVLTRLRNAAAGVGEDGDKASRALEQIGVTITDSRGQLLNFAETLPEIIEALRSIEDVGQRGVLLQDIFGIRQARDFNALLNLSNQEIQDFITNINNSAGAADAAANRILQGTAGAITEFNSALEGFQTETGQTLSTVLEPIIRGATELLRSFAALPEPVKASVIAVGGFTTAIAAAVAVVAGLTAANRLLGVSETAKAAAIAVSNAAQNIGAISATAYSIATTKLTIASIAQAKASKGVAAAETIRAAATNSANVSTATAIIRLGALAGAATGAIASLALVASTYSRITSAGASVDDSTENISKALVELDEALLKTAENSDEAQSALSKIADQNYDSLVNELGAVQNFLDGVRRRIPFLNLTAAEASANRQTVAFGEQLIQIDNVISRYDALRGEIVNNGNVSQEVVEAQTNALQAAREELAKQRPVTEVDVQAKQVYIEAIERSIEELNNFGKASTDSTAVLDEGTEAVEDQTEALKVLREELKQEFEDAEIVVKQTQEDNDTRRERAQTSVIEDFKDTAQANRQADQQRFEEELTNFQRQQENESATRKRQLENELSDIKKQGEREIQQLEKDFTAEQQRDAKAFAKELAEEREQLESGFDTEIEAAEREIDRRLEIQQAESKEEKKRLEERFVEEDKQLRARAELEAEILEPILQRREEARAELETREEEFRVEQEQKKIEFETNTLLPLKEQLEDTINQKKIANEDELRQVRLNAEDEIKSLRLQFEQEQAELKKQTEENVIEIRRNFEDENRDRNRTFESEQRDRRRAFEQQMRDLNLENAEKVRDTIGTTSINPSDIPAFKKGGLAQPGLALVGEEGAELVRFNTKTYVHNAKETRNILSQAYSDSLKLPSLDFTRPTANLNSISSRSSDSSILGNQNKRFDREIFKTLQNIENKLKQPTVVTNKNNFVNQYQRTTDNEILRRVRSEMTDIMNLVLMQIN